MPTVNNSTSKSGGSNTAQNKAKQTKVDDDWGDEGDASQSQGNLPSYIGVFIVTSDYIPTSNKHLTLFRDELVYVYKKSSDIEPGFWEGECNNQYGPFPPDHVTEHKI
ncbi:hypothetical protein MIR68_007430 [Amoeboaphelidium protococcarum]|nr:hypothetical protein MIR68_007430 [Amoeboaphelidium protococcarum]